MKRAACVLLCLSLLLSGCGLLEGFRETERPTEAVPTETGTVTPTVSPEPASGGHLSGGVWVYDNYTPREEKTPHYTRLREERIEALAPGDYGLILPYAAAPRWENQTDGWSWLTGYTYGFVTKDGMIVCDAAYDTVRPLLDHYDDMGYPEENDPDEVASFWVFSRVVDVVEEHPEGSDYTWKEAVTRYGAASLDGRVVTECKYESISYCPEGFIARREDQVIEVHGKDGTLRFDTRDLPRPGADGYCYLQAAGGYFAYACWDTSMEHNDTYLLGPDGRVLLGPCCDVGTPGDGLVPVTEDGDRWGYQDLEGNWVIRPDYAWANSFTDGLATVRRPNDNNSVIDTQGRTVLSSNGDEGVDLTDGIIQTSRYSDQGQTSVFYDRDGNLLLQGNWEYRGKGLVLESVPWDETPEALRIRSLWTGKEITVEGLRFLNYGSVYYQGQDCVSGSGSLPDPETGKPRDMTFILSREPELLAVLPDEAGSPGSARDDATGEQYALWYVPDGLGTLYRDDGTVWYRDSYGYLQIAQGYLAAADDACFRLLAPDGTEVMYVPFVGGWDD